MNYITRNLETVVSQVTKEYPVVLVAGPRQVGKTTMLQKLMAGTDRDYVSMKTYLNSGREPYMYYYRDKDAKEIDLILEHDGVLNPIEIKKTSNPGTELIKVFGLLDRSSTPRSKQAAPKQRTR